MTYDNLTTWRLYGAEHSVALGSVFADIHEVRAFVRRVKTSRWWRTTVPDKPGTSVKLEGYDDQAGTIVSFVHAPDGENLPVKWLISIHPKMLNDLVVLHELAHCIAPRWTGQAPPPKGDRVLDSRRHPIHGAGFAGAFAELAAEFAEGAHHDELRAAFAHFEVPTDPPSSWREAVEFSLRIERWHLYELAGLERIKAEVEESMGDRLPAGVKPVGRIPDLPWGFWLESMRRRPRDRSQRMSQAEVALRISQIEPCTSRTISTIEHSPKRPDSMRLRRVAMAMAVVLGLDPIYARHQLGLVRWECGYDSLEELRLLNPEWVALVEHLNQLLQDRPPRWVSEGAR